MSKEEAIPIDDLIVFSNLKFSLLNVPEQKEKAEKEIIELILKNSLNSFLNKSRNASIIQRINVSKDFTNRQNQRRRNGKRKQTNSPRLGRQN
jgi:hypothetical protein